MAYILPQVKVFQEFQTLATTTVQPLNSFIFGENFNLFRYDVAEEKELIGIGEYDRAAGNTAAWPNKPANSPVDQQWSRLFFDNAWLEYFHDYVGSGHEIKAVDGYPNRIYSASLTFATYGSWARSADFKERDVQVGDGIVIKGECAGEQFTFMTKVARLINDVVASQIDTPYNDASNAPATTVGASMSQESGTTGTVTFSADGALYDGTEDGDTVDSYYLTVTVGGDFGTAELTVTSASGNDDQADPLVPADGVAAFVGSRGLKVTFNAGSVTPFEVGQVFRVDVNQTWVVPTCTIDPASTYGGANDGTYIITVVEGTLWANGDPKVFVSSTGTLDSSGPYDVVDGTYITLPSGVRFKFDSTGGALGLNKDDRYYVDVTAQQAGAIHTIETINSLPDAAFGNCYGGTGLPVDLELSLSIVKNIEVPRIKLGVLANWETSTTAITVNPSITAKDASWYDSLGNLLDMPVIAADMYIQYRSYRMTYISTLGSVDSVSDVEGLLGPISTDNPLALAVYKAVQNSGGTNVMFMATEGPDFADFMKPLEQIYDREDVYGLVPLTHDKNILDAVFSHCIEASTAERGRWRVFWAGASVEEESAVLQKDSSGDILYGTITEDADTPGTQYTILTCNEAQFITNGVLGGQIVRGNYFINPNTGEEEYSEWIIDEVLTEEQLRLATGPDLPITVPSRFEVWKENSHQDIADQVIALAASFASRRARVVFPDRISNAGVAMDSMYLCAALAGLRSGVWPHQGLTNVEIIGFDDVSRTTNWLGGRLLDEMASNGVWIVTQDVTGYVYTRHQLTTNMVDVNRREDSCVANFDSISYQMLQFFRDSRYIGRRNITPTLLTQLTADLSGLVDTIKYNSDIAALGPQILDATITKLERHPTLTDHVVAEVLVDMPEPFNNFELTLVAQAG